MTTVQENLRSGKYTYCPKLPVFPNNFQLWCKEEERVRQEFKKDLLAEHGFQLGDKFGEAIYKLASDKRGRYNFGFSEILAEFKKMKEIIAYR